MDNREYLSKVIILYLEILKMITYIRFKKTKQVILVIAKGVSNDGKFRIISFKTISKKVIF